jgi:hypothetical protein
MVARVRDDMDENWNFYWLDKAENRRVTINIVKHCSLADTDAMMALVDKARAGSTVAQDALGELEREFLQRGEPPPTYLAAYLMDRSAERSGQRRGGPRRKPGPQNGGLPVPRYRHHWDGGPDLLRVRPAPDSQHGRPPEHPEQRLWLLRTRQSNVNK